MKTINHQAVIGAVIAAAITIGATAASPRVSGSSMSPLAEGPSAWVVGAAENCSTAVLDRLVDAYGALLAGLRQI